ncbi:MAG: cytidylate kinase-like family protein [Christensenellaceae bacterium]|jgi:cytidylate kinase|nr:cytidylate kinase-like family protein [Christensenellaceae bacterium]
MKSIITIGRQFGSGGRAIGKRLSEILGIPFYDKELIELAAEAGGMSAEVFSSVDEKAASGLVYSSASLMMGGEMRFSPQVELPLNDKLFILSSKVISSIAAKGPCVLIGRCADYVLRENKLLFSAFIHAPLGSRLERVTRLYSLSPDAAEKRINREDKQRSQYYVYFTGRTWASIENYQLALDSSLLGEEGTAQLLAHIAKERGV